MITNKNMGASDSDSDIKKHEEKISGKYEEIEDIKKKTKKKIF